MTNGGRKIYVPWWDKGWDILCHSFLRALVGTDLDRAASFLFLQLDQRRQERWGEAGNPIDFSHSSRKAWSTINNLNGRSGHSSRLCLISV